MKKLLGEFLSWFCFLLFVSGVVAGGGWYILHTRFDDAVRRHVEAKFRIAYPEHQVTIQGARRIPGEGIELRGLTIAESGPDGAGTSVLHVDEMLLQCNAALEELLAGKIAARQLVLRRLKLDAVRNQDGQWNLSRLLPLPRFGSQPLPILIENSTAEISMPSAEPNAPLVVTIEQLTLTPPAVTDSAAVAAASAESPSAESPSAESVAAAAGAAASLRQAWSFAGTLCGPHVQRLSVQGQFDPTTGKWTAGGDVRGLILRGDLIRSLPLECREYAQPCDVLDVTVHARFSATNEQVAGSWCRFNLDGELAGRLEDARLPFPLTDLRAAFKCDGRSLSIESLSARAGQSLLQGSCRIGGFFEDAPCKLNLSAKQLHVDRQLASLLPADWRVIWDKVEPEGLVDAELELDFDGRTVRHWVVVDCRDVSFAYHKFRYRLHNGAGRVSWRNGVLEFNEFKAFASGKEVGIQGRIENPGPNYTGHVAIQADQPVPVDDRLIAALPESARRIVNRLQPQGGFVTVRARFERLGTDPAASRKELRLGLQDCSMTYELFPYPLSKIHGVASMKDDRWTLENLTGVNDSARVACNGGWSPDENGMTRLALRIIADDVPIEDELRDALRPEARRVWSSLQPTGTVDKVDATVEYDGQSRRTKLTVTALKRPPEGNVPGRTITVKPTWLPYKFDDVQGQLRFHDGVTELTDVRGEHGGTVLLLKKCSAGTTDEGLWRVDIDRVDVDRLEVTHDLLSALPPRLGAAVGRLNIAGPVNLSGSLILQGEKGSTTPKTTQWNLDFDVEGGGLHCGVRLDHIHGGLNLAGVHDASGLVSRGWLNIDSLVYQGIQCTKVHGPISLDGDRLGLGEWASRDQPTQLPRQVSARVFGGELRGNAEVRLSNDFPFHVEAGLFGGDLAMISREATSRPLALSGQTFATVRLAGNSKGKHTFRGAGSVQLQNADIYELPVLWDMLKLLKVKRPDGTAFTSSDVTYQIEGDRVYFDKIVFDGDVIRLDGKGDMTLERAINLTFHTSLASYDVRDIILRPLLQEAGKQLLVIQVTGTLDNPRIIKEPLRNIRENIQSILPVPSQAGRPVMSRLPAPPQ